MIFTLGILDLERGSISTVASIFSLLPFFSLFLLFFSLFFYTSDTHRSPSHPFQTACAPFDCSFIPFLDEPSPFFVDSLCLLSRVAILRSSSILRPRTLRFFPPFFSASTSRHRLTRHDCSIVLQATIRQIHEFVTV